MYELKRSKSLPTGHPIKERVRVIRKFLKEMDELHCINTHVEFTKNKPIQSIRRVGHHQRLAFITEFKDHIVVTGERDSGIDYSNWQSYT